MKRIFLSLILSSITCLFNNLQAQVAARKGATLEDIHLHINDLTIKNDKEAKEQLLLEAKELIKSKNERWVILGANLLESLQKPTEAQDSYKLIIKKFPKGVFARIQDYNKVFDTRNKISLNERENLYNKWLEKFPINSFDKQERTIYIEGDTKMAVLFINDNNIDKAISYIEKFKSDPNYPVYINQIGSELIKKNHYDLALSLLEPAFNTAREATSEFSTIQNKLALSRAYYNLAPNLARVLTATGKNEKAIEILEELSEKSSVKNASSTRLLANTYMHSGRYLDAFTLLQNYLTNNESDDKIMTDLRALYIKLNKNITGNLEDYFSKLTTKSNDILSVKYRDQMTKKVAPNFSLLNMNDEIVTLSELKGKVVILDFWATWCGPCKQSFPGMQAAVDKYKDDKDVVFLFIDVWQKEENYKELAQQFIKDNKYSFHVLFDEMKDRANSTASAYGVRGIPTKIVIDREGYICFESSGGSTEIAKIVNEMSTKIELAKKGS